MELNELTSVIERSMKTVNSNITRSLARSAAYEVLTHYENKANQRLKWEPRYSTTDQPDDSGRWARICYYNGLQIGWINRVDNEGTVIFSYKTTFPVSGNDLAIGTGFKYTFQEAKDELEKMWSKFLQKIY